MTILHWVDKHKIIIWLVSSIVLFVSLLFFVQDSVWWHYILYFLGSFLLSWFFLFFIFFAILGLMQVASYTFQHPKQAVLRFLIGVLIICALVAVAWFTGWLGRLFFGL